MTASETAARDCHKHRIRQTTYEALYAYKWSLEPYEEVYTYKCLGGCGYVSELRIKNKATKLPDHAAN